MPVWAQAPLGGLGYGDAVATNRNEGATFEDEDVARAYRHRAPYAPALVDHLVEIAPATRRALDLGCGPGKIAHDLALRFDAVDAVDPSARMLAIARERPSAIHWIQATGEAAKLAGPYDLVTAGASIHWMDHGVVFPKLRSQLADHGVIAFVDGDGAHDTPWDDAWLETTKAWLARLGKVYDERAFHRSMTAHEDWVDVLGRSEFVFEYAQRPEHFIEREHSRATWARSKMGPLADEMDEDLRAVIAPHVVKGLLHFKVKTEVVWGVPRVTPRAM